MSAENLKGCRPIAKAMLEPSEGVVDHSTKIPGAGSKDPIPLKSVSADKSHSMNPVPDPKESGTTSGPTTRSHRYWKTPPKLLQALQLEFNFDCDPCPHPRPKNFNSLVVPWGKMNFVNPPFHKTDGGPDGATTAFVRKAISEHKQGKKSVILLPIPHPLGLLISEGATLRNIGRVQFQDVDTGEPNKKGSVICIAILK